MSQQIYKEIRGFHDNPSTARQSDINSYLQTAMPFALQADGFDHYKTFKMSRLARWSGTIMPPGPAVEMYSIEASLHDNKLSYTAHIKWRKWVSTLIRRIEPWQITHRSRKIACSHPHMQANEIDYRLRQMQSYLPQLTKNALSEAKSRELYDMIVDVTRKYLKFNREWIQKYIKDHSTSSLGFGHKWNEAYQVTTKQWEDLYQIQLTNWEMLARGAGYGSNITYLFGIRSRAGRLEKFTSIISEDKERDRIVIFFVPLSTVTLFLPQKSAWYTEILQRTENIVGSHPKYYFPYAIGGQIYDVMAEKHKDGERFHALDGSAWDSSVGILLGDSFKPFFTNFKGVYFLPSGISLTSLLGTVASVVATRDATGEIVCMGDDVNYFGKNPPYRYYMQEDPGDTKYKYALGVTYGVDPYAPRITGFKVTMDRSKKSRPFHVGPDMTSTIMGYKRDVRSQVAWAGLFEGRFGDRTLIESLRNIPAGEYLSPGELMERLIEEGTDEVDVFAWAEQEGIKNVFT